MAGRRILLAAVAVVAVALGAAALVSGVLGRWELDTVDARFDLRGERPPHPDIAVVGVDEATLGRTAMRWPFPRDEQARLVDALRRMRPRLIVYDLQITERSGDDAADLALFDAISRARPVVMAATDTDGHGRTRVFGGEENLRAAGARAGSALISPDHRRVPLSAGGLETIAVTAARLLRGPAQDADAFAGGGAWIDFAGPARTYPLISWDRAAAGSPAARRRLEGRVVIVGLTAPVLQDMHATPAPGEGRMSGPEVQANAVATVLRGAPLRSAGQTTDLALVAVLGALVPVLALRFAMLALLAAPVAAVALLAGAQAAFGAGRIVAVLPPGAALAAGAAGTAGVLLATEVRRRRLLHRTIARFVPDELVDDLVDRMEHGDGRIAAVELDATVLFCDLRGFTAFAERHPAALVIETLDRYLAEVAEAVMAVGGTVVTFLGDGVMAVFGAPVRQEDHAARALRAARDLLDVRLPRLNAWLAARRIDAEFELGVGVHSGPVMSGTVGSERRVEYAAVGDTTNVAARLQARTKEEGVPLLVSEATCARLAGQEGLREIGCVELRGRAAPLRVWTVRAAGVKTPEASPR